MATMFTMKLTKPSFGVNCLNEKNEISPGIYNPINPGLSACTQNVTNPVSSDVFTLIISGDTEDCTDLNNDDVIPRVPCFECKYRY